MSGEGAKGRGEPRPFASEWPDLVYDLGASNGDDSAYYLSRGYRVVAVEARPDAIEQLRARFSGAIRDGQLVLVGKGVAERRGTATFWLCEDEPEWSTFDRSFADKYGDRHRPITVPTCTFAELLKEFGRPFYCKIDIEGCDHLCLDGIDAANAPKYLSMEVLDSIDALVERMRRLGYGRFKLISMTDFSQPSLALARMKASLRQTPAFLRALYRRLRGFTRASGAGVDCGPSGPFGEDTPGRWMSAAEIVELAKLVRLSDEDSALYDLHARFGDA